MSRQPSGHKCIKQYFDQVRKQFIDKKPELMEMVASFESQFSEPKEFQNMFDFMNDFYEVIESDSMFDKIIVSKARTK